MLYSDTHTQYWEKSFLKTNCLGRFKEIVPFSMERTCFYAVNKDPVDICHNIVWIVEPLVVLLNNFGITLQLYLPSPVSRPDTTKSGQPDPIQEWLKLKMHDTKLCNGQKTVQLWQHCRKLRIWNIQYPAQHNPAPYCEGLCWPVTGKCRSNKSLSSLHHCCLWKYLQNIRY